MTLAAMKNGVMGRLLSTVPDCLQRYASPVTADPTDRRLARHPPFSDAAQQGQVREQLQSDPG